MKKITQRPRQAEYSDHFTGYVGKVQAEDVLQALKSAGSSTPEFFKNLPEEKWSYRYAPGKWDLREVLQHLIDSERVFSYRAMCIARGEEAPLPGFDDKRYAATCQVEGRSIASLLKEYKAVRASTVCLFQSFTKEDLARVGRAGGAPASALSLAYVIAGHEQHHLDIIRERYL